MWLILGVGAAIGAAVWFFTRSSNEDSDTDPSTYARSLRAWEQMEQPPVEPQTGAPIDVDAVIASIPEAGAEAGTADEEEPQRYGANRITENTSTSRGELIARAFQDHSRTSVGLTSIQQIPVTSTAEVAHPTYIPQAQEAQRYMNWIANFYEAAFAYYQGVALRRNVAQRSMIPRVEVTGVWELTSASLYTGLLSIYNGIRNVEGIEPFNGMHFGPTPTSPGIAGFGVETRVRLVTYTMQLKLHRLRTDRSALAFIGRVVDRYLAVWREYQQSQR